MPQPAPPPTQGSPRTTQGSSTYLDFPRLGPRYIRADFDGDDLASDGGARLLRQTQQLTGIVRQFAAGFTDYRHPHLIEHAVADLIAPRVHALTLGDQDLNDHHNRRPDLLLAPLVGQPDPTGPTRQRRRHRGQARAAKSTLNRRELTPLGAGQDSRSPKITGNTHTVERLLVMLLLLAPPASPSRIVLDLDATNDPIHGPPLGRFFHGSDKNSGSLPWSIVGGEPRLCVRLRPSDLDAHAGALKPVKRLVTQIRAAWPPVRILSRVASGFCREGGRTRAWTTCAAWPRMPA